MTITTLRFYEHDRKIVRDSFSHHRLCMFFLLEEDDQVLVVRLDPCFIYKKSNRQKKYPENFFEVNVN